MLTHTLEHTIPLAPPRMTGHSTSVHGWSVALVLLGALTLAAIRLSEVPVTATPSRVGVSSTGAFTSFSERRSHGGLYTASIVDASPMTTGAPQSWTLHLSRRAPRVANARVTATVWMPDDTVRSPAVAAVRYVGGGNYRIDRMTFSKAGWWNVALVIDGDRGTDSVASNVVIPAGR